MDRKSAQNGHHLKNRQNLKNGQLSRKHLLVFLAIVFSVSSLFAFLGFRVADSFLAWSDIFVNEKVYSKTYAKPDSVPKDKQAEPDYIMTATAYTDTGETKSRIHAGVGGVAVDRKVIPHGTLLYIEGYGLALAIDTGRLIKGNRVDVWFPDKETAIKWGRKKVRVWEVGQADIKKILSTGGKYIKY